VRVEELSDILENEDAFCPFYKLDLKQTTKERGMDLKIMDLMELMLQIV